MKQLTLVRHAKSSWDDMSSGDHGRVLNRRGIRDAPTMGQRLRKLACIPDDVLCSTAARAKQTATLMLPELDFPEDSIRFSDEIYEASLDNLCSAVASTTPDIQHLMLIGHNPGLETLCNTLLAGSVPSMPTAAVSSYRLHSEDWLDIALSVGSELLFHNFPKQSASH